MNGWKMQLTGDMIKLAYYFAGRLSRMRKELDHRDIAHEAMVRILKRKKPIPKMFLSNYVRWQVLSAWREYHTNRTSRKHNILLEAGAFNFTNEPVKEGKQTEIEIVDTVMSYYNGLPEHQQHWFLDLLNQQGTDKVYRRIIGQERGNYSMRKMKMQKGIKNALSY